MVAFVTGGSGAIGSQICKSLCAVDWDIAIGYNTNAGKAVALATELSSSTRRIITVRCDLCDIESICNAVLTIKRELGNIDLLVNNAGIADINLFTDVGDERLDNILNTNLIGAMRLSRDILPDMIRKKSGNIINISSMWGETGASCEVAYSASKAGLIGFTKALAKEVGPSNIRVNCISAGLIDTPMNSCFSKDELSDFINDIPLSRAGTVADIANAVVFLSSDASSYITGEVLRINGGFCT